MRLFVQNLWKPDDRLPVCHWSKFLVLLFSALLLQMLAAQEANHQLAQAQVAAGNFSAAEITYGSIYQNDPADLDALLQRAIVRSWQNKHLSAQNDFQTVLESQPENINALSGFAYSLAWSGELEKASRTFKHILALDGEHVSSRKGLALVALWSGDSEEAVSRFKVLKADLPEDDEVAAMLGYAYLSRGKQGSARKAFEDALQLNPDRLSARTSLQNLRFLPSLLELNFWSGYSSVESENILGVRSVELATAVIPSTRLWVGYDNTLSLDNRILIRDKDPVPSWYGGALFNAGEYSTTKAQYGWRELNDATKQHLITFEEVLYPSKQFSIKAGTFIGLSSDNRTDFSLYGGVGLLPSTNVSLEPVFFYTRVNQFDEEEWRIYVNSEYRFAPEWRLSGGLGFGNINSSVSLLSGAVASGHIQLGIPFASRHIGYVLARYEDLPNESLLTFSLGLKLRLERR